MKGDKFPDLTSICPLKRTGEKRRKRVKENEREREKKEAGKKET